MIDRDINPIPTPYELDVGRPNVFTDDDKVYWRKFQQLVIDWPHMIVPNAFYHCLGRMLEDDLGYKGEGLPYMFWFMSDQDMQDFKIAVERIVR